MVAREVNTSGQNENLRFVLLMCCFEGNQELAGLWGSGEGGDRRKPGPDATGHERKGVPEETPALSGTAAGTLGVRSSAPCLPLPSSLLQGGLRVPSLDALKSLPPRGWEFDSLNPVGAEFSSALAGLPGVHTSLLCHKPGHHKTREDFSSPWELPTA